MVLGNELVAASDPNEDEDEEDPPPDEDIYCENSNLNFKEEACEDEEGEDDGSDMILKEGPPPNEDDDCVCMCFCEDEEEASEDPEEEEEEEELVDPQDELKEKCSERKECVALKERLDECNARVESRSKTSETCVEEIIDFMHCVDHCVSKSLFSKLK